MEKTLNSTTARGTALGVFIVISLLFSLYGIYGIIFNPIPSTDYLPSWYKQFLIILNILDLLSLIGLWLYKKWALYLFVVLRIILHFIGYFNMSHYQSENDPNAWVIPYIFTAAVIIGLIFDGIFLWLLYKKRDLFK